MLLGHAIILWVNKFKVKTPNLGRYKNNKLTLLFGGTIATIFLLIMLKAWLSARNDGVGFVESMGDLFTKEKTAVTVFKPVSEPPKLTVVEARQKYQQAYLNSRGVSRAVQNHRFLQQKIIKDFQKTIHLKMNFPAHMDYVAVDLEDDIGAVVGSTFDKKESFAVVATSKKVTLNQVLDYIQTSGDYIPMMKGHKFEPEKAQSFTPPSSTGLAPLTIIPSTDVNGKGLFAVFAPRADEKGSYLFMMEAEKNYFERNEDGFEKMLEGMKAEP